MKEIKLKNLSSEKVRELLPDNLIHLGFRGSIAHGMYVPQNNPDSIDDKDIMGIYVGELKHYIGFGGKEVKEKFINEWDAVSYELRKFIGLCLQGNPNVLGVLWLPEHHIIYEHPVFKVLRENRNIFVTKKVYHSFNGYAYSQFKRMTHLACEGYMGAKRKELVQKFGYDCKNAAHLIRLLRMGIEFLVEGNLHVHRNDSEQLLSIKRGEWSLDKVKEESERLFKLAEEAYIKSSLPPEPDRERAENICMEMIRQYHSL